MGKACGEGDHVVSPVTEEEESQLPLNPETEEGPTPCWEKTTEDG